MHLYQVTIKRVRKTIAYHGDGIIEKHECVCGHSTIKFSNGYTSLKTSIIIQKVNLPKYLHHLNPKAVKNPTTISTSHSLPFQHKTFKKIPTESNIRQSRQIIPNKSSPLMFYKFNIKLKMHKLLNFTHKSVASSHTLD